MLVLFRCDSTKMAIFIRNISNVFDGLFALYINFVVVVHLLFHVEA